MNNSDHTSDSRKADHINLALEAQLIQNDKRFYYEPILAGHPQDPLNPIDIFGKQMLAPIWISSMTGGTSIAGNINRILATACSKYGLGMGLGSCRSLLYDDEFLADFQLRSFIGDDVPLMANLGIAQIEELIKRNKLGAIKELIAKTETDGLIIHINPLQEWLQPEGDRYFVSPMDAISRVLEVVELPVVVKEVGQGMGPKSLEALCSLPLAGIDFAAFGGTNFSKLEMERGTLEERDQFEALAHVGHTLEEMITYANSIIPTNDKMHFIASGGIKNFLDG